NTDDGDVHDLVLETGHDSGRLAPGEEAEIDVGVVGRDLDGWCSVVGHRQMGMTLQVVAIGGNEASADAGAGVGAGPDSAGAGDSAGGSAGESGHVDRGDHGDHGRAGDAHPMAGEPADDAAIIDPTLPALPPGTVHRHTFHVTEQDAEVAPGITQRQWTFNGTAPGPTLRGKVGDTFVITLVHD